MSLAAYIAATFRIDPVMAISGDHVEVAIRLAAADNVAVAMGGRRTIAGGPYAGGMDLDP